MIEAVPKRLEGACMDDLRLARSFGVAATWSGAGMYTAFECGR